MPANRWEGNVVGDEPILGEEGPLEWPPRRKGGKKEVLAPRISQKVNLECPRCRTPWGEVWEMDLGKPRGRYKPTPESTLQPSSGKFTCPNPDCTYYVELEWDGPHYVFILKGTK